MSFDSQTLNFEHRRALLQLGGLLSENDSKKIVFLVGLPKSLEEKAPWEVLAHLEVQGKATVEELTKILKAIDRQDVAKKAKESIGKINRKKITDSGSKALMLRDSLQLAMKQCKLLVDQVDYLKVAANKDGNKRIEQIASEAKENLINQVQIKLRYASALFQNASDSVESSSPTSSLEGSPTDRSPVSSPPSIVRSCITASELKQAAENLKKRKGRPLRSNPHAIWRHITGGQLKKAAEKIKKKSTHKENPSQLVHQIPSGTATIMPTARPAIQLQNNYIQVTHSAGGGASTTTLYQAREEREGEEEEDPYSSISEIMPACSQNALSNPHYENVPLKCPHPPIACSENHLETGSNSATIHPGAIESLRAIATSDVSSVEDYSTCSYTGDSGFSDSRAFMKELPGPPSPSEPAKHQNEQASDNSSVRHASLNTADVRTGYYKSLNPESRIPDVIYEQTHASGQSSSDNK